MGYRYSVRHLVLGLLLVGNLFVAQADAGVASDEGSAHALCSSGLSGVVFSSADSAEIVTLLRETCGENEVIYYARRLLGRPYVAHTLEVADSEKLVVNLRELDCTTLVETVCALALTKRQCSDKFADYCRNLEKLRYFGGHRDGYCSRLHYFTWWMKDNMKRGWVAEVGDSSHFAQPMMVNNGYMSKYPHRYRFLKNRKDRIKIIRQLEMKYNGSDGKYLPKNKTGLSRKQLSCIQDGDIIAIVTSKDGLDYSHLGFAAWGEDGRLHLLNASMVKGRVIEDDLTLEAYLQKYKHTKGIKVLRLR